MDRHSEAFRLITRIQDEAHRFAITYHRTLRGKHMSETALMKVPGIGREKAARLIKEFGSAENVRHAGEERIAALEGFSLSSARKLLAALNAQESGVDVPKTTDKTDVLSNGGTSENDEMDKE